MSLNKVLIIGNLGKDPEVRFTPGGRAVARFPVATSEVWSDQEGQRQERTEWHNVVVLGQAGRNLRAIPVEGPAGVPRGLHPLAAVRRQGRQQARRSRVPMGILFTGPMGTGKTFVAEACAKECGLTTIKLKNFRSKWVGATEGNLEKILTVIKAIGQVVLIIDEGDRAFGNQEGE